MNIFTLARRNIWRNKRRTLITAASIFFAVFFAVIMRSMQLGTYAEMIKNVVSSYTGHIQIHKKGYWNDKIIITLLLKILNLKKTFHKPPASIKLFLAWKVLLWHPIKNKQKVVLS